MAVDPKLKDAFQRGDLAFLLGNGINRYNMSQGISWDRLLLDLYYQYVGYELDQIPPGIHYTEFYDLIFLGAKGFNESKSRVAQKFADGMNRWSPSEHHEMIVSTIESRGCPLLTTNFDMLLPRAINSKRKFTLEDRNRGFSDFYPWEMYYANEAINSDGSGFGIWFVNGSINYRRSIKLGLMDYMGNVDRLRSWVPKQRENFELSSKVCNTWVRYIFERPMCIVGLGLDEQEVFMRWMLTQRKRHFIRTGKRISSWYIYTDDRDLSPGKQLLLEALDFSPIKVASYDYLYGDFWKELNT